MLMFFTEEVFYDYSVAEWMNSERDFKKVKWVEGDVARDLFSVMFMMKTNRFGENLSAASLEREWMKRLCR